MEGAYPSASIMIALMGENTGKSQSPVHRYQQKGIKLKKKSIAGRRRGYIRLPE